MLELARFIKELTGTNCPIKFEPLPKDDPQRRLPDITRAKTLLGWEPRVDLQTGLRKTIDWYRDELSGAKS